MTEQTLNQLTGKQLAELARNSAIFLAAVVSASTNLELYYYQGQFIEVSYRIKKRPDNTIQWRIHVANYFPDIPDSTNYLTIYLQSIKLSID